jgi:hypothetical protein
MDKTKTKAVQLLHYRSVTTSLTKQLRKLQQLFKQ